jgi:hypothetical protein
MHIYMFIGLFPGDDKSDYNGNNNNYIKYSNAEHPTSNIDSANNVEDDSTIDIDIKSVNDTDKKKYNNNANCNGTDSNGDTHDSDGDTHDSNVINNTIDNKNSIYKSTKNISNKMGQFVCIIASGILVLSSLSPYFIINNDIKSLVCNVTAATATINTTYINDKIISENAVHSGDSATIGVSSMTNSDSTIIGVSSMTNSAKAIILNLITPASSLHNASLKVYICIYIYIYIYTSVFV